MGPLPRLLLLALALLLHPSGAGAQESRPWVASRKGEVYYWSSCDAAQRLAVANRIHFRTEAAARAAGYRRSTARGCAGPSSAASPQRTPTSTVAPGARRTCTVARISDGDTLACRGGERVRLLLIDAPETTQRPYGTRAREALARLAPVGSVVHLEHDVQPRDRYGRTLAYVWTRRGMMVNEEVVRQGFAVTLTYAPNVRHVERVRTAQTEAQRARRGLWATSAFECAPRDHRAGKC